MGGAAADRMAVLGNEIGEGEGGQGGGAMGGEDGDHLELERSAWLLERPAWLSVVAHGHAAIEGTEPERSAGRGGGAGAMCQLRRWRGEEMARNAEEYRWRVEQQETARQHKLEMEQLKSESAARISDLEARAEEMRAAIETEKAHRRAAEVERLAAEAAAEKAEAVQQQTDAESAAEEEMAKLEAEMAELGVAVAGVDAQHSGGGRGDGRVAQERAGGGDGTPPARPGKGGEGEEKEEKEEAVNASFALLPALSR